MEEFVIAIMWIWVGIIIRGLWEGNSKQRKQFHFIISKLNSIMATLAEVQQAIADLQASVDEKQACHACEVDGLAYRRDARPHEGDAGRGVAAA